MKTSTIRVVAAVCVLALVLGGAGAAILLLGDEDSDSPSPGVNSSPTPTPTPDAGSSEPPKPALEQFYTQQLEWEPCRGSYQCATLTVPVDYKEPDGETIELALLKVNSSDPDARIGSLVVNPGGPGAPGTDYAEAARQVFREPITEHFDVVGFDPRGTGDSAPVDCLSDAGMDALLQADPVPDDQAETDEVLAGLTEYWEGCVANTGDLVGHVTTIEAARDMDVLRSALGESTLTYFGASYGTQLGATYADLFPDNVGRLVLDGAIDVSLDAISMNVATARGFERALTAYVENCLDEGDCFLGSSVEEGLQTIRDLLAEIDADPLPTADDRELTAGTALLGLIFPLYNRDYWFLLDQGLQEALDGSGATLQVLADAYSYRNPDGSYASNILEVLSAVNCLDNPFAITPAEVPAQIPRFVEASPTFGEVFAWGLVTCGDIQVEASEKPRDIRAAGAAPIVVVGTTRDPATPYEGAVALADQLESGVLVSRDGDGHTAYNSGNECIDTALEAYLIDGTVPEDGLSC